ncbi:MAG: FumA C-terminus/TtdB family hydratase beta subunit [Treponema sp.]|nr:FumA C-terminus/TtdB family hydratase beta subunit [Treponema sp.]
MERISLPLARARAASLSAGDRCLLSGVVYTARDAAHKRLVVMLDAGEALPFPLEGACIYYAGPTPAPPGRVIGAIGPTTSGRMDVYTPRLLSAGLLAMIGKGERSNAVVSAIKQAGAVYFGALGGAGALLSSCVREAQVIAFPDLGTEAIHRLVVEDFPVTVINK